jgi:hypothetical protein
MAGLFRIIGTGFNELMLELSNEFKRTPAKIVEQIIGNLTMMVIAEKLLLC